MGLKSHHDQRPTRLPTLQLLLGAILVAVVFSPPILAALPGHSPAAPAVTVRTGSAPAVPLVPTLSNRFLDSDNSLDALRAPTLAPHRPDMFGTWDRLRSHSRMYQFPRTRQNLFGQQVSGLRSRVVRHSQIKQVHRADRGRTLRPDDPIDRATWARWRALAQSSAESL